MATKPTRDYLGSMPPDVLAHAVRMALASGRVRGMLNGGELLTLALFLSGKRSIDPYDATALLLPRELSGPVDEGAILFKVATATKSSDFVRRGDVLAPSSEAVFRTRLLAVLDRLQGVEIPVPSRARTLATAAGTPLRGARRNSVGARKAPSAAPRPKQVVVEPVEEPIPPPEPPGPCEVTLVALSEAALVTGARQRGVVQLVHTVQGHLLSVAERYDELLALGSVKGVDHHRYQIETVRRVLKVFRGRALLADEVGLGKTIEALLILREYQLRGMVRRALVITPSALVQHWRGELQDKAGIACRTTEDAALREDPESFWQDEGVVVASLPTARSARHSQRVQAVAWDMAIVDEAHHVKNRSTVSWKLVDGLRSRFLLLVTATPIENDLEEIYTLVTLLKPGQFATPAAFRRQFLDAKNPTSPRNRERLRELLSEVMVRNTRAQSGLALPPRYVTTVVVQPTEQEAALYDRVVVQLRKHAAEPSARLAASSLVLQAGSSPNALRGSLTRILDGSKHSSSFRASLEAIRKASAHVIHSAKTDTLLEVLAAHPDQALIFTRYRDTLEHLAGVLATGGVAHVVFHGGMSAAQKSLAFDAFRGGTRVMLATDVGGEGQNLQFCHLLINFDLPWNPMVVEQRIGRLHRMGQTEDVRVFNLCAAGTIEDRILDVLDRRLHLFELVVGEMDMVLGNLTDDRAFEQRLLEMVAGADTDQALAEGFDRIASEIAEARGRYDRVRAFDEALFGRDLEA